MINLYIAVKNLKAFAVIFKAPYTNRKIETREVKLVKNMGDMEQAQGKWLKKDRGEKTWKNFNKHFQMEWNDLRCIRGPTMKETIFQERLNFINKKMHITLQKKRLVMVQEIANTYDNMLQTLVVVSDTNLNRSLFNLQKFKWSLRITQQGGITKEHSLATNAANSTKDWSEVGW